MFHAIARTPAWEQEKDITGMDHHQRRPDEDTQLVRDCVSGSQQAWTELYSHHHPLIEAIVRKHVPFRSTETYQDLVQMVYVRLVDSLETYDSHLSSLRTFVSLVAKRTCIDWLRGQSRMSRTGWNEPVDHHDCDEEGAVVVRSNLDLPDEQIAKAQNSHLVRMALSRLADACRELLRLRFYLDLTYGQIGERLGRNENTVNVQILRCLAQLK